MTDPRERRKGIAPPNALPAPWAGREDCGRRAANRQSGSGPDDAPEAGGRAMPVLGQVAVGIPRRYKRWDPPARRSRAAGQRPEGRLARPENPP